MGVAASKKVEKTLKDSPEFDSACNSVYSDCLNLTQHAFPGVLPYQLSDASDRLHLKLSTALPLVKKWASLPPSQTQVDQAFKSVESDSGGETLNSSEFKAFAVELFRDAIVSNVQNAVLRRVPIGIAGIAGFGMVTRSGKDLVGGLMGIYALGVAAAVYLNLSG
ncbi:uncharacterized protein LOC143862162 [Tasmannia lanceolata]|uniref:uncharacterized protein LOC143862162 n=1 Tax=Tasmannia lanceolata TaxID=3420 RepID=UPI004063576D